MISSNRSSCYLILTQEKTQLQGLSLVFFKFIQFAVFESRFVFQILHAQSRSLNTLYSKIDYYISILGYTCLCFLLIARFRPLIFWFVLLGHGIWVPQIIQNIVRNQRKPFERLFKLIRRFIIGTTITRLMLPVYAWLCPRNALLTNVNVSQSIAVSVFMILQVIIMLAQDRYGPRMFIPDWVILTLIRSCHGHTIIIRYSTKTTLRNVQFVLVKSVTMMKSICLHHVLIYSIAIVWKDGSKSNLSVLFVDMLCLLHDFTNLIFNIVLLKYNK